MNASALGVNLSDANTARVRVSNSSPSARVAEWIRARSVIPEDALETQDSQLVFGRVGTQPVVLKIIKRPGDEWRCGEILEAFDGNGTVRVHKFVDGAALLERVDPGSSLANVALSGDDDEATEILAGVIRRMSPRHEPRSAVSVQDLGKGLQRYLLSNDEQIPKALVEQAQRVYVDLCASQTRARLLHGDLHHYNVLLDRARGWVAIDPKGLIGETEYEIGAALRNPYERPGLFATPEAVQNRLRRFETVLGIDSARALAWGFTQAVLATVWSVEEGSVVSPEDSFLRLAATIRPMLGLR